MAAIFVVYVFFVVYMNHGCPYHVEVCTSHKPHECGLCEVCGSCVFNGSFKSHVKQKPHGGRENVWGYKKLFM